MSFLILRFEKNKVMVGFEPSIFCSLIIFLHTWPTVIKSKIIEVIFINLLFLICNSSDNNSIMDTLSIGGSMHDSWTYLWQYLSTNRRLEWVNNLLCKQANVQLVRRSATRSYTEHHFANALLCRGMCNIAV